MHHRIVVAAILAVLIAPEAQADDNARCQPAAIGTATARSIVDARTVLLTDGREARLAGIEVPGRGEGDGPTRAAMNHPEAATNPIMLQGDHGPIAVRNIYVHSLRPIIER